MDRAPPPPAALPAAALAAAVLLLAGCPGTSPGPLVYFGTVESQPVLVGSKVGGRVEETLAREGDLLEEGDPIARLAVPELQALRDGAAARVAALRAALDEARHGPRRQEIGEAAAAAEAARARLALLEAGARAEEIAEARATLGAADADLAQAERELERVRALHAAGSSARDDLDAATAARDRDRGRRDAAKARLDLLLSGSRKEAVAEAAAEVRRLEAREALLRAGTRPEAVAAAEARVEEAAAALRERDASLAEAVVRSPGKVVLEVLSVRRGDLLAPGDPVARLHGAEDLWVKVFVPETELGRVKVGQEGEVAVDSFPDRTFAGRVVQVAAQAEYTPRNVQSADERRHQVFAVKVRVDDPGGVFQSGMAARVRLLPAAPDR